MTIKMTAGLMFTGIDVFESDGPVEIVHNKQLGVIEIRDRRDSGTLVLHGVITERTIK